MVDAFNRMRLSGRSLTELRVGRRLKTRLNGKLGRGDIGMPVVHPGVDDQGIGPNHVFFRGVKIVEEGDGDEVRAVYG